MVMGGKRRGPLQEKQAGSGSGICVCCGQSESDCRNVTGRRHAVLVGLVMTAAGQAVRSAAMIQEF